MPAIIAAQASDSLDVDVSARLVDQLAADGTDTVGKETEWEVVVGELTYRERIHVATVDYLRGKVISLFHDNPEFSHFGALKTAELVSRDIYCPAMDSHVHTYVSGCKVCHSMKAPQHATHGINMPLETPSSQWEGVTMAFVTVLSELTASGYGRILVIMNRLTKMAMYLQCRKDIDLLELAQLFLEQDICKRGVPDNIVTDHGAQFTSRFWTPVCSHLGTDHRLLIAFHPQTDGRTERWILMMEEYLRAFCNYKHDNWVELLQLAKFAYNNAIHTSPRMTPFCVNYNYHPVMQFKALKQPSSLHLEIQVDTFAAGLQETHQTLLKNLQEA